MEEVVRQYNAFEAILWTMFAIGFAIEGTRGNGAIRKWAWILSGGFLAFGFSDYVEMSTGAWWHPPWLLILKLSCGCVFTLGGYRYWRTKRLKITQQVAHANAGRARGS